jgi:hypothetical protein
MVGMKVVKLVHMKVVMKAVKKVSKKADRLVGMMEKTKAVL